MKKPRRRCTSYAARAGATADVADAIAKVRASRATPGLRLGFEFMVLTAARAGEVRGATWTETDLDRAVWTVPGERMKMEREHRVPLSGRTVEVFDEAPALSNGRGLVFPGRAGRSLRPEAFIQAIKRLGIEATAHGFRSSQREPHRVGSRDRASRHGVSLVERVDEHVQPCAIIVRQPHVQL